MLDACGDEAIGFGIRHILGHFCQLFVFEELSDLRADPCTDALARRDDRALWKRLVRSPDVDRQDAYLLVEREITDDRFELGDLPALLPAALGKDEGIVTVVEDLRDMTQRLPQRARAFDWNKRGEIVHVRTLI